MQKKDRQKTEFLNSHVIQTPNRGQQQETLVCIVTHLETSINCVYMFICSGCHVFFMYMNC